jgi:hypothetical protein
MTAITCVLAVWALLSPLQRLAEYQTAIEPFNPALRSLSYRIQEARKPGESILLDSSLDDRSSGRVSPGTNLGRLLALSGTPGERIELGKIPTALADRDADSVLLVSSQRRRVERDLRAQELTLDWDPPSKLQSIRVYRVTRPASS